MLLPWMIPMALLIGLFGTRGALQARHLIKAGTAAWWLVLAWSPLLCWMASQMVVQD